MLCCLFYVARPINRFRDSWYVLHLGASFWRVTETTKSVHTWLKTPGAFTYTKILGELKPETLSDLMLRHKSGKVSAQSLLADKDLPREVRTALNALHQSTSAVVGSDGHRRLLQKEGWGIRRGAASTIPCRGRMSPRRRTPTKSVLLGDLGQGALAGVNPEQLFGEQDELHVHRLHLILQRSALRKLK